MHFRTQLLFYSYRRLSYTIAIQTIINQAVSHLAMRDISMTEKAMQAAYHSDDIANDNWALRFVLGPLVARRANSIIGPALGEISSGVGVLQHLLSGVIG